jgi:hypothetical protein
MGRPVRSRFLVTEHTPGYSITIETVESTFPITVTRTVEPIDGGHSRVIAEIGGSPSGILAVVAPLTRRLAQRSVDADYDRLVELFS